jgi:hypothetical protein
MSIQEETMNILSMSLLLWQTAMLRCTVWFLEASHVSLRQASRGLQKQPNGRPNRTVPLAQDPQATAIAINVETQTRVLH